MNKVGLAAKGAARGNVPGTDQRHCDGLRLDASIWKKPTAAAKWRRCWPPRGEGGFMATILREPGPIYSARYDKVPLEKVAAADRTFPKQWIATNGYDVTDDFVRYARPLVGEDMITLPMLDGRQRLTRFQPIYAEQKLPKYVPQADRKK